MHANFVTVGVVSLLGLLPTTSQGAGEWSIETDESPTTVWEPELTEGTWMSLDVSPDGQNIVFDLAGHLFEMPIEGGRARALTEGRSWNQQPRYSPDGRQIAFSSDRSGIDSIWILDRDGGALRQLPTDDRIAVRPSWSVDGRQVYALTVDPFRDWSGVQTNLLGGTQALVKGAAEDYANQFSEDPVRGRIYFEANDLAVPVNLGLLQPKGARIKYFDRRTGEVHVYIQRLGGAFNPTVSPDGRWLAFVGRDDLVTNLFLRDLQTGKDRTLVSGISRDHQENQDWYGKYPGMGWAPDSTTLYYWSNGSINAVNIASGQSMRVPFVAPARRDLNQTIRVPVQIATERTQTRMHRWAQPIGKDVLFETLGDLYLKTATGTRRLTDTPEHETSPLYDPRGGRVVHAVWSDDSGGSLVALDLGSGRTTVIDRSPGPFGSIATSPDGQSLAYLRAPPGFQNNWRLHDIETFELVLLRENGNPMRLIDVAVGSAATVTQEQQVPPAVAFSPAGDRIWFTEQNAGVLELRSIATNGMDERLHFEFPDAARSVVSPDLHWIAVRQYHRTWLVPNDYVGQPQRVDPSKQPRRGVPLGAGDGTFAGWSADSKTLFWTRGAEFLQRPLADILASQGEPSRTSMAVDFDVSRPSGRIALRHVRAVTMDPSRTILEDATVLLIGDRIEAIGADIAIPDGARVFELAGHTVTPGLFDAHMHYGMSMTPVQVIEQRVSGLLARLAYGVTSGYEVMGHADKDVWLSDMVAAGRIDGPRLFTVGEGIFGLDSRAAALRRPAASYEDMREHVQFNKDSGATALKDYANFTRRARHQLATAAREVGINVISESAANFPMNMTQLIDGMTGLEHTMGMSPLYEDVLSMFSATEMGITPTLGVVYNGPLGQTRFFEQERLWEDEKLLKFATRDDLLVTRRPVHYRDDDYYAPEMARWMKALHDRGVPILVGGHGEMLGLDMHWEMQLLVAGGFTPLEALASATIDVAKHHGLDRYIGSIEVGKLGDLVIFEKNPTEDIQNSLSIRYVIRNGIVYSGDDAAQIYPESRPARPMYFQ